MELNEQIKKYRTEMNLSQEELAEKIYVTRQSVSNWENGKTYPDIHSLLLLGSLFGISLDQLVKGDIEIMKKEIKEAEIIKMKRYGRTYTLMLIATAVSAVPLMESYREMTTPAFNQVGRMYGYGLFASSDSYAYHGGNIGGYTAFDGMDSAYDCNIFLANNQAHPRLEALAGKLLKLFREAVETSVS